MSRSIVESEILALFESNPGKPWTATEVGNALGMATTVAVALLHGMRDRGMVYRIGSGYLLKEATTGTGRGTPTAQQGK